MLLFGAKLEKLQPSIFGLLRDIFWNIKLANIGASNMDIDARNKVSEEFGARFSLRAAVAHALRDAEIGRPIIVRDVYDRHGRHVMRQKLSATISAVSGSRAFSCRDGYPNSTAIITRLE